MGHVCQQETQAVSELHIQTPTRLTVEQLSVQLQSCAVMSLSLRLSPASCGDGAHT